MSDASEVKDADRGPHEVWCDTQNAISERCNCMASSYIDQIEDHDRIVAELKAEVARQTRVIEELMEQISELTMDEIADRYDLEAIEQGEGT